MAVGIVTTCAVAALTDLRSRRIPNLLTLAGLGAALVFRAMSGLDPLLSGLYAVSIAFVLAFILFALGAFGGGDGKLLIATAAFLGLENLAWGLAFMALFGGILCVWVAYRQRALLTIFLNTRDLLPSLLSTRTSNFTIHAPGAITVPYGVAIGAGALLAFFA